jgi:hypothetical protein
MYNQAQCAPKLRQELMIEYNNIGNVVKNVLHKFSYIQLFQLGIL